MKLLFYDFELPFLIMDSSIPVGGACVRQYAFSIGLSYQGQKVGILTWENANNFIDKKIPFELIESYSPEKGIRIVRWLYYRFPKLLKAVKNFEPDFIFQKCAGANVGIMAIISLIINKPFIYISANNIDADDRYKKRLNSFNRFFYRLGLKLSKGIICQNKYQYKLFKMKFPQKKITVIRNPYILKEKIQINSTKQRKYIAWIGIFQYQKNLPALYQIANNNPDMEFLIAGKENPSIDENTKDALNQLKTLSNVKFVGYLNHNNILDLLSKAYALLNTSHYEGFSNTFLESFAVGTPIISLNVNPDNILTEHGLGYVMNSINETNNLIKLISSINYRKEGEEIQQYLINNHDHINVANQFIEFLEN